MGTLAQRVLAHLKEGDEGKLIRFENKVTKYLDKQIAMRKESIEGLREKINDSKEALNESVISVDATRINGSDGADKYVSVYIQNVSARLAEVEQHEESIKKQEDEILHFEKLRKAIYPEPTAS